MKTKPCSCCEDSKPGAKGGGNGYGYNRLGGDAREWAKANQLARSEYCVHVKGGKRFEGPEWIKNKCGDGRMGFSTRRKNQDEVRMERGLDGQLKRKRTTLLNKRSARAAVGRRARRVDGSRVCLVSSGQIMKAQRDLVVVAKMEKEYKKFKRAQNRNNRARRSR